MYKRPMLRKTRPEGYTKMLIAQKSPAKIMYIEELLVEHSGCQTCSLIRITEEF